MKYICKQCGINHVDIDNTLCTSCRDLNFRANKLVKSITAGITMGRGRKEICDHENKGMWDYHTKPITDLYGNEGTIDTFTCAACGEVMEEERTS